MPERWSQLKGDPSARALLFGEKRVPSLFDERVRPGNAAINRVNGRIGMTFSRDGSHCTDCEDAIRRRDRFGRDP